MEAYLKGLQIVRDNPPDTFILGCNVSQTMVSMGPVFGLIDAMWIGPDNGSAGRGRWVAVKVGARDGTNLYFLNGRVWHVDVLEEEWDAVTRTLRGRSRVVTGDPYELRIALPARGEWRAEEATAGKERLVPDEKERRGFRLGFTPETSGVVEWSIRF